MKALFVLPAALALAACGTAPTTQQAAPVTAHLRVGNTIDDSGLCYSAAALASSTMRMRQMGFSYGHTLMTGRRSDMSPEVLAVADSQVAAAYAYPIVPAYEKEAVIAKFGQDVLRSCLSGV